jgi:hypothetical protein
LKSHRWHSLLPKNKQKHQSNKFYNEYLTKISFKNTTSGLPKLILGVVLWFFSHLTHNEKLLFKYILVYLKSALKPIVQAIYCDN